MQCSSHYFEPSSRHWCLFYGTCSVGRWWRLLRQLCLVICVTAGASGCTPGRQTVLVPANDALFRAGPDVQGRVYVWNGKAWELSANRVHVPEGWFIGPLDAPPDNEAGPAKADNPR